MESRFTVRKIPARLIPGSPQYAPRHDWKGTWALVQSMLDDDENGVELSFSTREEGAAAFSGLTYHARKNPNVRVSTRTDGPGRVIYVYRNGHAPAEGEAHE